MRTHYRAIARVQKTHGKKGEVVAVPVDGLPLLLHEGLRVAVVPPRLKGDRFHQIVGCSGSGSGQLVKLSGVSDLDGASKLVGRTLLAAEDDLPEGLDRHDVNRLLDREVIDERFGSLGTISEVMVGAANDVWVVDGPFGEVLLPVIDDVVGEVGPSGPITVRVPDGLIDEGGD